MPRFVIHIGPHKTGSSYLQWSFRKFRNELLAHGVYYPDEWDGTEFAHFGLVLRLRHGEPALPQDFDRLFNCGHPTVLLSAEDFSGLTDEQLGELRRHLRDAEVEIVFYCRCWSELLPSTWREYVKQGQTETFPEFLTWALLDAHLNHVLNFGSTLAKFANFFGHGSLRLVSFNEVLEQGDDLFVHFCRSFLDWDRPPLPDFGRVNESLSMIDTELVRQLNALRNAAAQSDRPYLRFVELKQQLPIEELAAAMTRAMRVIDIDDASPVFVGLHTVLMDQFGDRLVAPNPGRLFRRKRLAVEYVGDAYLLEPGIADAIREISRRLSTPAFA